MKKITLILSLFLALGVFAQEGLQFGINVSPAYKRNMSRQKLTGLRSGQGGYGFAIGLPVKYWMNEFTSFNSGIDYNYTAFDSYFGGVLSTSFRFNSLDVPLMFNTNIKGNWYGAFGSGVVYNLSVKELNTVAIGTNVTAVTNRVQPYLGLGLNSFKEQGNGALEMGIQVRYQLLDVWKNDYQPFEAFNSHIVSLDVLFRYYL